MRILILLKKCSLNFPPNPILWAKPAVRIIGIDPGSQKTGYGIIDYQNNRLRYVHSGCIHLGSTRPLADRLLILFKELEITLKEFHPEQGAIEKIFFGKNAQSALTLGHARGVAMLQLISSQLSIHEYTPLEVKQSVVGVGRASKEQVQHMVKILLNQKSKELQEDEADALAVAITHAHSNTYLQKRYDRLS